MFKDQEKEQKEEIEEIEEPQITESKQDISLDALADLIQISVLKILSEMYIPIRIAEKKDQDKVVYYGNFVTKEDMMKIAKEHGYVK